MSNRATPAHFCQDGHEPIWHNDSTSELCPLCRAKNKYMGQAFGIASQHIDAQHAVWDATPIQASALLDLLAKNVLALNDHDWDG